MCLRNYVRCSASGDLTSVCGLPRPVEILQLCQFILLNHLIFTVTNQTLIIDLGDYAFLNACINTFQIFSCLHCLKLNIDMDENTFCNICDDTFWYLCYSNVLLERIIYCTLHCKFIVTETFCIYTYPATIVIFLINPNLSTWFSDHAYYPQEGPRSRRPLCISSSFQPKRSPNDQLPVLDRCNKTHISFHVIIEWLFPRS